MKETYEKILGRLLNGIGNAVAFMACLPVGIAFITGTYFLFTFFKNNDVVLPDYVWQVIGVGFSCFLFVFLIFAMAIMQGFVDSLKKLYHEILKKKTGRYATQASSVCKEDVS